MDKDKLIQACKDLRVATLKAKEQGIINISGLYNEDSKEQYQIYEETLFIELATDKLITKKKYCSEYEWKYTVEVDGLTFFIITNEELEI